MMSTPPPHSSSNYKRLHKDLVAAQIRMAYRKLAHARRLRLSGERILAAAVARCANVYPIDCKLRRNGEEHHAVLS